MEAYDPSTSECLRILLEEQHRRLRSAAQTIASLHRTGMRETQPTHWSGLARISHDDLAQRMMANLAAARHALDCAADESARAVATLATRVG